MGCPTACPELAEGSRFWVSSEAKRANALKSKDMLSDLEYSYSPVRDKVRALREYL